MHEQTPRTMGINQKEFPLGSVVYYVKKSGSKWEVSFGIVEQHYPGTICLQLLEPCDYTLINGIPKKELVTPTKWQKLPKGWTWNTKLFETSIDDVRAERMGFFDKHPDIIKNPEEILSAYQSGIFVKVQDNDHSSIEAEIDKKNGWRIVRRFYYGDNHPMFISVDFREVYRTYEEAQKVIDAHEAELKRQTELSEYDWSVEHIDYTLDRAIFLTDLEREKYREWLLTRDHVEDIEVRCVAGNVQWKYWKNKKWMNIEI